jgi:hypothetical protein
MRTGLGSSNSNEGGQDVLEQLLATCATLVLHCRTHDERPVTCFLITAPCTSGSSPGETCKHDAALPAAEIVLSLLSVWAKACCMTQG